jgi:hypothetical protein
MVSRRLEVSACLPPGQLLHFGASVEIAENPAVALNRQIAFGCARPMWECDHFRKSVRLILAISRANLFASGYRE